MSDPAELAEISEAWDRLVRRCSTNPYLLTGFVEGMMELDRSRGWSPLLLHMTSDGVTVGVAPLMTKTRFGMRRVQFLFPPYYSPDFVLEERSREPCLRLIVQYLFETLHCTFADLILPAESPSADILRRVCERSRTYFSEHAVPGHVIIRVKGTWDEFRAARSANFRRQFKALKSQLDQAGSWRIIHGSCDGGDPRATERIHLVESVSWKVRKNRTEKIDEDLPLILRGSARAAKKDPDFKSWACFLELDGQTLSYVLVLEYRGLAVFAKTSFDERFSRYSPGTFVCNESIRRVFDEGRVTTIDFATDLPLMQRWSSTRLGRVRVTMCRGHVLPIAVRLLMGNVHRNKAFARIWKMMSTVPMLNSLAS
jgi:hypothetical protein